MTKFIEVEAINRFGTMSTLLNVADISIIQPHPHESDRSVVYFSKLCGYSEMTVNMQFRQLVALIK